MKKSVLLTVAAALLLAGCKGSPSQAPEPAGTSESVIEDMVNIDEIIKCERILEDSALMDGTGEQAWKRVGEGMIRIRDGNRYFLRITTKKGTVTSVTYRYE